MLSLSTPKGVNFHSFGLFLSYVLKGTYEEQGKVFAHMLTGLNDSTTIKDLKTVKINLP